MKWLKPFLPSGDVIKFFSIIDLKNFFLTFIRKTLWRFSQASLAVKGKAPLDLGKMEKVQKKKKNAPSKKVTGTLAQGICPYTQ